MNGLGAEAVELELELKAEINGLQVKLIMRINDSLDALIEQMDSLNVGTKTTAEYVNERILLAIPYVALCLWYVLRGI